MEPKEKIIKTESIYEGRILALKTHTVEMQDKKYSKREIVEHPSAVVIIPVLPDGQILFVNNFRIAVEKELLELPAGLIDHGEEPREAALRELLEETGCESGDVEFIFDAYSSPGFTNEKMHFFLANACAEVSEEIDEEISSVERLTLEDALRHIETGEIVDAKTILGILYLSNNRK